VGLFPSNFVDEIVDPEETKKREESIKDQERKVEDARKRREELERKIVEFEEKGKKEEEEKKRKEEEERKKREEDERKKKEEAERVKKESEERKKREEEERKKKEEAERMKKESEERRKREEEAKNKEEVEKKRKEEELRKTQQKVQQGSPTRFKALFDYTASETNEISFKEGDIITLVEKYSDNDWWKGRLLNNKEGLFPSTYVEELKTLEPTSIPSIQKKEPETKKKMKASYDYTAQEENELSFREGDVITLIEKYDDSEWWQGELNGKLGLFPSNFTQPL